MTIFVLPPSPPAFVWRQPEEGFGASSRSLVASIDIESLFGLESSTVVATIINDGLMPLPHYAMDVDSGASIQPGRSTSDARIDAYRTPGKRPLTVADLRASGVIGLWKDRDALGDSAEYARQLRAEAWQRPTQA
jgi:hypothetical protein